MYALDRIVELEIDDLFIAFGTVFDIVVNFAQINICFVV
jgi:hypothetical protein